MSEIAIVIVLTFIGTILNYFYNVKRVRYNLVQIPTILKSSDIGLLLKVREYLLYKKFYVLKVISKEELDIIIKQIENRLIDLKDK